MADSNKKTFEVIILLILFIGFVSARLYIQHIKYPHLDFFELVVVSIFG